MKKLIFTTFIFLTTSLTSCLENEIRKDSIYKEEILRYLNELKDISKDNDSQLKKINDLSDAINFKNVEIYNLRTTEQLIIAEVTSLDSFENVDRIKVVFFLNQNEIVRSNIVSFTDKGGFHKHNEVILSVLNMYNDRNEYSGRISFFSLFHHFLLFNNFEKGKLNTNGIARKNDSANEGGKTNGCIDWYLVTTWYYADGSTRTTEQFLYTTCGCEQEAYRTGRVACGGGGGSSGGGSSGPVFPSNPQNNDEYEFTSKDGEYTRYKFDSQNSIWVVVERILPPLIVESEPENYPFLDIEWPVDDQEVLGTDNFIYTYDGSTGNWHGERVIAVISPDRPISNMTDYLKCFSSSQNAQITIYVNQPIPNSSATHDGGVVGHTFVSISQNGNVSVFGFYPSTDNIYPIVNPSDPSAMGNDSNTHYDVSVTTTVTGTVLQQIINYSVNYPNTYDLNSYNCSDFGIAIGNLAGLNLPEANGTWLGGGGSNPGVLGQHIRNMTTLKTTTKNTTGGTSPSNVKNCN